MKCTPCLTNRFAILEECTDSNSNIQDPEVAVPNIENAKVVPESDLTISPRILIRSSHLRRSTELKVHLQSISSHHPMGANALLDSGATGLFIDAEFVKAKNLTTQRLPRSILLYNIDGTLNEHGSVKETVDLIVRYQDHTERATFYVTTLGGTELILGHPWLMEHNPEIDWTTGRITMSRCPGECRIRHIQSQRRHKHRQRANRRCQTETQTVTPCPPLIKVEECENIEKWPEDLHPQSSDEPEPGDRIFSIFLQPEPAFVCASSTISQRLAEASEQYRMAKTWKESIPNIYHDFEKVFLKKSFDELPQSRKWDHAIELVQGAEPFSTKLYPMSLNEQDELDRFLDENLKSGRIRPSKSPMASPVFFIKKKDGTLRFVQDYRKLNMITIKNSYPLPLVPDILSRVSGATIFSKLDVRWGYNNVRIKEGDEWKAAFRTNRGLFEPLVMFFGLCNSPATFQTMMNELFRELIEEGVVAVYMDDILIFTKTLVEHRQVVRRVLQILSDNNLFLKPEKCIFETDQIEFVGFLLSNGKIEMDPVKVTGVRDWPTPHNVTEVQSFLGFINFYRRFIDNFSHIAHPLHQLTRKDAPWTWGSEEEKAFQELKRLVTSFPILVHPDPSKRFRLETDSSGRATGSVLSMLCDDEKWRPVGFYSKGLSPAERNYDVHDKELLSIIRGLEEWRHILEGAKHQVEILNDHRNLTYFTKAQRLNRRQARWSLYLSRFNFTLIHRPGKKSGKPDALSRRADHETGDDDNSDCILLPPDLFNTRATGGMVLEGTDELLMDRIKKCKNRDESVVKAFRELGKLQGVLHGAEWAEEEDVVLWNGKIYVPLDPQLRHDILHNHHDTPIVGHPGRWKTLELVTRNFWWPGISRYVANYVKGCDRCNRAKVFPTAPAGKLMPNTVPTDRWQVVTVDLIPELPPSQGFDCIWVAVDRLGKRIHVAPTTTEVDSVGNARLFRDNVWRHHGLPEQIISDRGSQFVSDFTRELNRLLGIQTKPSTAFHPQTDGQTERINQEIEQYLRMFANQRQDDWAEWLPLAEFAYNNRIHASTRRTPFEMDTGRHPRMGFEPRRQSKVEAADEFVKRMKKVTEETRSALQQAASDMARFYNHHRSSHEPFKVGEKVWLDSRNIKTTRPAKKLDDKWFGPFIIEKVVSPNAYRLKLTTAFRRLHPVFNITLLRRFNPDTVAERPQPDHPEPELDEKGEETYEVEAILDSRLHYRKLQYLVSWKGYGPEYNTWEPYNNMEKSKELVDKFHQESPSAPRRISATAWRSLPFRPYKNVTHSKPSLFSWISGSTRRDAES